MKNYIVYNLDCEGKSKRGIAGYISTDEIDVEKEFADKNTGSLPHFLLKSVEISVESLEKEKERLNKLLRTIDSCLV